MGAWHQPLGVLRWFQCERCALCWTLHKLSVGLQSGGDRLQISTERVGRFTWRRVIGFRSCAFLGVNEVEGPVRRSLVY